MVAILLPTWGVVSTAWARGYRHLGGPLGSTMIEMEVKDRPIAEARNQLMADAVTNGADFAFFIGDDVIPPPDAIIKLLHRAWQHPEIDLFTGVYWTKTHPTEPYLWRGIQRGPFRDWKHGEFVRVEYAGCDCLLIRLSDRMKALGPHWFDTAWTWNEGDPPSSLATEDFYFYTNARKAGIELWADTEIQCLHEDRTTRQLFGLLMDMPQATGAVQPLPDVGDRRVRVADIGAGYSSPWFGNSDEVELVRFDGQEETAPDFRCDVRHLPAPDESFDIVHSRHVLEHFGRAEVVSTLREWLRVLRVGGELRLNLPNVEFAMRRFLEVEEGKAEWDQYWGWQLYGSQSDRYDYHKTGFTPRILRNLLTAIGGLDDIEVSAPEPGHNLVATARKVEHAKPLALIPEWEQIVAREGQTVAGLVLSGTPVADLEDAPPLRPLCQRCHVAYAAEPDGMCTVCTRDVASQEHNNGYVDAAGFFHPLALSTP